jgi:2,4-dienoyl-CoA reductase-like NADH-dependent reductase (Old Yellow Enzyme family)
MAQGACFPVRSRPHGFPTLFQPFDLAGTTLENRITVAPMCQYSAVDGCMTDWHLVHLSQLALSGVAAVTIEATAVLPEGRISDKDVGLWDDTTGAALADVVKRVKALSATPLWVQLAHAGRKASTEVPWLGGHPIVPSEPRGWQTVAPSPVPFHADGHAPLELDRAGMERIRDAFVEAAKRAIAIGLDGIEIHAAHGYLLHQFLSPLSNRRTDDFGGDLAGRMRFPLEVIAAVRAVVPETMPLVVRVSATDWVEGDGMWTRPSPLPKRSKHWGPARSMSRPAGCTRLRPFPWGPTIRCPLPARSGRRRG